MHETVVRSSIRKVYTNLRWKNVQKKSNYLELNEPIYNC